MIEKMTENKKNGEKKETAEQPSISMPDNTPNNAPKQEEAKKDEKAELIDLLQRTQANFENYRKQTEKRFEEMKQVAAKDMIIALLPMIDNFELALKTIEHKKLHQSHKDFIEGIELIYSQIIEVLKERGVERIGPEAGSAFDPYYHEALMKVDSEMPENRIMEVFQKGFTLHNSVIRPAKVKVSAGKKTA